MLQGFLRFLSVLFLPSRRRLMWAGGIGAACVGGLNVPFLGLLLTILAWPLIANVWSFYQTGPDVEYWFLGLLLKSPKAYICFFLYYAAVAYLPLFFLNLRSKKVSEQPGPAGRGHEGDSPQ